jgi:hypothetical protein
MSALSYLTAWQPLAARIRGLERAANVHARFLVVRGTSPYGADKTLQLHCEGIRAAVVEFQQTYGQVLPVAANAAIDRFMEDTGKQIVDNRAGDDLLIRTIIVKIVAFEAEITYCLHSPTEALRSASELAFLHLQNLIVVDGECRDKWQNAFAAGETNCERLGAVHLLWHGIWAFKADGSGGRTDLVYREGLRTGSIPTTVGMVLTEWKVVAGSGNVDLQYEHARSQAASYASGALAGVELASHRYLIAVSQKQLAPPSDVVSGGVTYRHINIAVDPDTPSLAAKKLSKTRAKS